MREKGFTLIELMIVIAIIAILAAIAIPNLLAARSSSNETAALSTLRTIVAAQATYQAACRTDDNNNGIGEYATLGDMAAQNPPYLPGSFLQIVDGRVSKGGYYYVAYLLDSSGDGVPELATGGRALTVDPDNSESFWLAYAWPVTHGTTGNRTFMVNWQGEIIYTNGVYDGLTAMPGPPSAFLGTGTRLDDAALGSTMPTTSCRDGNFWKTSG